MPSVSQVIQSSITLPSSNREGQSRTPLRQRCPISPARAPGGPTSRHVRHRRTGVDREPSVGNAARYFRSVRGTSGRDGLVPRDRDRCPGARYSSITSMPLPRLEQEPHDLLASVIGAPFAACGGARRQRGQLRTVLSRRTQPYASVLDPSSEHGLSTLLLSRGGLRRDSDGPLIHFRPCSLRSTWATRRRRSASIATASL
jgi:hypothetical protein